MNKDDWVELTHFDPLSDLSSIWEQLGSLRVFACDDDGAYAFIARKDELRHVVHRAPQGWICPCGLGARCPAVLVMQVVSFPWTQEQAAGPNQSKGA